MSDTEKEPSHCRSCGGWLTSVPMDSRVCWSPLCDLYKVEQAVPRDAMSASIEEYGRLAFASDDLEARTKGTAGYIHGVTEGA